MSRHIKTTKGFTLIELLVVIAIIGVLASLLFPAIQSAIYAAEKQEAQTTVNGIESAVMQYWTEYNRMPYRANQTTDAGYEGNQMRVLVQILIGDERRQNFNPRLITFLDANVDAAGTLTDPWGNQGYGAKLDIDYDNQVDNVHGNDYRGKVVVWNNGRDGNGGNEDDLATVDYEDDAL